MSQCVSVSSQWNLICMLSSLLILFKIHLLLLSLFGMLYRLIDFPFWRVPIVDCARSVFLVLLYSGSSLVYHEFRMCYASILINFAEQVLAVDQLQSSSPQRLKIKPALCKLVLLGFHYVVDHISLG